jgi:Flp pilus assembly protein TadG
MGWSLRRVLRRFLRRGNGGVLVETAMIMPILVMLLLGGFEVGRYFLLGQKLQRAAMTAADLASRTESMTTGDVDDLFAAAREVARPFALDADARVIVTSIVRPQDGSDPVVAWQRSAGAAAWTSAVGAEGEVAALGGSGSGQARPVDHRGRGDGALPSAAVPGHDRTDCRRASQLPAALLAPGGVGVSAPSPRQNRLSGRGGSP